MQWLRKRWPLLLVLGSLLAYAAQSMWHPLGWAPTMAALVVSQWQLRENARRFGWRHATRWLWESAFGTTGGIVVAFVWLEPHGWLGQLVVFMLGFASAEFLWFGARNIAIGIREGWHRTREPELELPPALPVRVVSMDPHPLQQTGYDGPVRVIGPLDGGAPLREWGHTLRERGFCGAQPAEYVMDKGGFIVASADPTVHPGSIAACALPSGHDGEHSWQMRMEDWPWQSAS
jgi:hypothetical protein